MRQSTSITGCVRRSVGWSVGRSDNAFVRRSTRRTYWPTWPCYLALLTERRNFVEYLDLRCSEAQVYFRRCCHGHRNKSFKQSIKAMGGPEVTNIH